jgi:hypothetical protein
MKTTRFLGIALLLMTVVGLATGTLGQGMLGMSQPRDPSQDIAKLFGKSTAFTADATVFMKRATDAAPAPMVEFSYAMLDGKVRADMDMTKLHKGISADERAMMEQMGMARIAHVFVPEKKIQYMIYPGLKSYCVIASSQTNVQNEGNESKVERTELGKETVEGHPCVKWKVVVTGADGKANESIQWQATDLKDFPIKSETTAADGTVSTTLFKKINLSKPSASLFEPPADFKQYNNMQELMMGSMQRMMPPDGAPPSALRPRRGTDSE